jgi:ribulose 1,5-bisphosphate carboxylase large subunit-like protein
MLKFVMTSGLEGGILKKMMTSKQIKIFVLMTKWLNTSKRRWTRAVKETGKKKSLVNVSASDFDTMIERCEMIRNAGFVPGSYAFLIDGITAGWMAVQTLRRRYPDVFIHFHRAAHGHLLGKKIHLDSQF